MERESQQNWESLAYPEQSPPGGEGEPAELGEAHADQHHVEGLDATPRGQHTQHVPAMSWFCYSLKKNAILFNIHLRFLMFVQVYRFVYFTVFKTSNISVSIQNHSDLARIRARQFC